MTENLENIEQESMTQESMTQESMTQESMTQESMTQEEKTAALDAQLTALIKQGMTNSLKLCQNGECPLHTTCLKYIESIQAITLIDTRKHGICKVSIGHYVPTMYESGPSCRYYLMKK